MESCNNSRIPRWNRRWRNNYISRGFRYTAVAIGKALGSDLVQIYTDVDGIILLTQE
ncbi:MAG: hypothetical protein ACLTK8_01195 [Paeniclostridium sp.]